MHAIRWSDNDRYFGPFTYAREPKNRRASYRPIAIMLGSGDDDDYPGASLRLSAFGHTLITRLPGFILRPSRQWHEITTEPTRSQMIEAGRKPGYWDVWRREFGFSIAEGAIHWHYGQRTHDSETDRSKCWFMPWRSWRHVRRSFYNAMGEHYVTVFDVPKRRRRLLGSKPWHDYELQRLAEGATDKLSFNFLDYDGEAIQAVTHIEEREWHRGEGKFRWLSLFTRPKISRSLCITFTKETGKRKGSWKGGTVGHSIEMLPGELHGAAFRRYCAENNMTFVGPVLDLVEAQSPLA